jgi:DNA-binding response OmpR family regulator
MKVLIIDGARTLRELLRDALLGAGHQVVKAENGEHGLQRFGDERPISTISGHAAA